tara:strand:+ start:4876 stop:6021 length:1146 start_codon:yes stop_codon:yes gene_type:complete
MVENVYIYCDHNATTPLHPDVKQTFIDSTNLFGNASSLYKISRYSREAIEDAREQIASSLNASPSQLLFAASGTEANNQVLKHLLLKRCVQQEKAHVILSAIEHSSVLATGQYLEQFGIEVDVVPVNEQGIVNLDQYKALFKEHTALVSLIFANNEIGSVQPIKDCVAIAHEKFVPVHTDAVQAYGKCHLDVKDLDVDYMSLSGHKIYGPKGVGALYVKDDEQLSPLLHGGYHERSLRASTENSSGIIAFAKAASLIDVNAYQAHTKTLRATLKEGFLRDIPDIVCHGHDEGLTNTLNVSFLGVEGVELAMNCDLKGIYVSTGSACSSGSSELSHVIKACGFDDDVNKSSVRFSLGLTNTLEEIHHLLEYVNKIVKRMRQL